MKVKEDIDAYLEQFYSRDKDWCAGTGSILMGTWQMYEATKDEQYFSWIKNYLEEVVAEDGSIKGYPSNEDVLEGIGGGLIFFRMYDRVNEEKYRKAITYVMERLRECPRCACGNFLYGKSEPDESWLVALYKTQPFYMAYETTYGKKEKYNDIINQFENVEKFLYNENRDFSPFGLQMRSLACYLAAFVDTLDHMSFEIYEQYRVLQDAFKMALQKTLPYQSQESCLFPSRIGAEADAVTENTLQIDEAGSAIIGYSILKACRMGILLKEKYVASGIEIIESLTRNALFSDKGFAEDIEGIGMFIMACGEYLRMKKEMDENG